eukprot:COSAG01_NODE_38632_length_487_cov_0.719072_1_plen_38_part_10
MEMVEDGKNRKLTIPNNTPVGFPHLGSSTNNIFLQQEQ